MGTKAFPKGRGLGADTCRAGQQSNAVGRHGFGCPIREAEGGRIESFQLFIAAAQSGECVLPGLAGSIGATVRQCPDGFKIGPKMRQRTAAANQNIPVDVGGGGVSTQKQIVGIPSAQHVHGVIHDQVFVVHPIVGFPRLEQIDFVVKPHFHVGKCGQCLKFRAPAHGLAAVKAIQKQPDGYTTLRRGVKGAEHVFAAAASAEAEG